MKVVNIKEQIVPGQQMVVEEEGNTTLFRLGNLVEKVVKNPLENARWDFERNFYINGEEELEKMGSKTNVSDRYLPKPAFEIISKIVEDDNYSDLYDQTSQITLDRNGSIQFVFDKIINPDYQVMEITMERQKNERQKSFFGLEDFKVGIFDLTKLVPMFTITNSFNKTKAVNLVAGYFRLICSNGMKVPTDFMGGGDYNRKYRHYKKNEREIEDSVNGFVERILELGNSNNMLNRMYQAQLDKTMKDHILESINENWKKKVKSESYEIFKEGIDNTFKLFNQLIPKMNNLLDFENVCSYMTAERGGKNRFSSIVQTTSEEIRRTVHKSVMG